MEYSIVEKLDIHYTYNQCLLSFHFNDVCLFRLMHKFSCAGKTNFWHRIDSKELETY